MKIEEKYKKETLYMMFRYPNSGGSTSLFDTMVEFFTEPPLDEESLDEDRGKSLIYITNNMSPHEIIEKLKDRVSAMDVDWTNDSINRSLAVVQIPPSACTSIVEKSDTNLSKSLVDALLLRVLKTTFEGVSETGSIQAVFIDDFGQCEPGLTPNDLHSSKMVHELAELARVFQTSIFVHVQLPATSDKNHFWNRTLVRIQGDKIVYEVWPYKSSESEKK